MFISKHSDKGCSLALMCTIMVVLMQCCIYSAACSQQVTLDTLTFTSQQAEQRFLEKNLPLLAERLNIDKAEAKILQAKAWPNPSFEINDIQLYNTPATDASPGLMGTNFWQNKTFGAQLEQMVQLAGKRKKNIAFETKNRELAERSFTDFLMSLKVEFRQNLSELAYLQNVSGDMLYQQEIVNNLLKAQTAQYEAGNISQSQLFRLQALGIKLQADINEMAEQISLRQQNLKTYMLIDAEQYIVIKNEFSSDALRKFKLYTLQQLLLQSQQHNTAIKSAEGETNVSIANLAIEKANAVPDLNLSLSYDRNGNNQLDFVGAGVAIDLPVFNRNKGNVKAAQYEVSRNQLLQQNKTESVRNAVVKTWTDLNRDIKLYESINQDYLNKLNGMIAAVSNNFTQRNISLLEFLDFFESFRDSKEKYYEAVKNISIKKEDLNYLTGQDL